MPTVLLVRHGQASFGGSDYDVLSELGRRQAEIVGAALAERGVQPRAVVTGGLRRQIDTAEIAAAGDWPAPTADPRWDEYDADDVLTAHSSSSARLQRGEGEGPPPELTTQQFQVVLDEALHAWTEHAGEGRARQSWPAFQGGASEALAELAAGLGRGETGVVFTSAGTVAALLTALLELPARAFVAFNRVQINTAVTKVAFGASGASVVSFNDHSHLERGDRSLVTYR
jgi:broad specificity phosphatase PhoE